MSIEQVTAKRNAEQLAKAEIVFAALANLGMQPALECDGYPNHGEVAEFNVTLNPNPMQGVLHEDIAAAFGIAVENGGRLWLCPSDGKLCVVWPLPASAAGPDGSESPTRAAKKAAHGQATPEGGNS